MPILWLEKETCNSIASTTQNKFVTSFFKFNRPNWAILLLKYFEQPTICHLSHLTSTSGIWHNLKKTEIDLPHVRMLWSVTNPNPILQKTVSTMNIFITPSRLICYDTLIDCCTSSRLIQVSPFIHSKSESWLELQEIHTWKQKQDKPAS